jgi:predicted nucleic acid-binding protein
VASKAKLYVETTVISYLTAWPSTEIVMAAHQQITQEWWRRRRDDFDLFVSELVRQEASAGDAEAAKRRLEIVDSLNMLSVDQYSRQLASELFQQLRLPARALTDAAHIALAVIHGMDYLITWNCRHIANASLRNMIESITASLGYIAPTICTPEELMEELYP